MEHIFNLRTKVDRIVSERSFLNRREESEQLAFEAAKGVYHEQLERKGIIGPVLTEGRSETVIGTVSGTVSGTIAEWRPRRQGTHLIGRPKI